MPSHTARNASSARWAGHRLLHDYLRHVPRADADDEDGDWADYLVPLWDTEDGHPLLREPGSGSPGASEAFFLLHRRQFGKFVRAAIDDTNEQALQLTDDRGRIIELHGVTSGYGGSGPNGTRDILRLAGFTGAWRPGAQPREGLSQLEQLVFSYHAFTVESDGIVTSVGRAGDHVYM